MCVCLCARPAWSPAPPGWGCGAGVCGWAWVAAAPRHFWLGCWDVCVVVCAPRLYPTFLGGVCCVGVCARLGSRLHPVPLGWVVGVCVRSCVCPGCPRPSWGAACGAGVCGCCRWWGLPPPLPWGFFRGGLCGVGRWLSRSWVSLSLSPHPFSSGPGCLLFLFLRPSVVCVRGFECPLSRWAATLGLVLPVLAGWSPGASLGGPVFGAVWVGGLAASCVVGVRRGGCGPFSRPPPTICFMGGLRVSPSAFAWLAQALVGILCGFPVCCWWLHFARPCPGLMGRVGYVQVRLGAPSCRVRFWLCRLGGRARRPRVALS